MARRNRGTLALITMPPMRWGEMNFDLRTEPLANALNQIQNAQLIRWAEEAEDAYWFKHVLTQDTAYASLLKNERKRLHRLVAQTLERLYPERAVELAPRLAEHFQAAGETMRALHYFQRAAQAAAARYANYEALDFYTRALDAAEELKAETRDSLYRARGMVYERIGEFDKARADLERALTIARQAGDAYAEWQCLMDLGYAWTARDYARAGEYSETALVLARASQDAARIAHSLNRVGNWHVNNDEPQRAVSYHVEALSMFESLNDARGVAETQDLLCMASWIGADYLAAEKYANAALGLFETLRDPLAIANMRIVGNLKYALLQGNTVAAPSDSRGARHDDAEILQELRQLGWRSGEAFGLMVLGEGLAANGAYERALTFENMAFEIAREIKHRQWFVGATMLYGEILTQLLNFETARPYLETALDLARELGSKHWMLTGSGFLASNLIAQKQLTRAAELLDAALPQNAPAQSVAKRQVWAARAELALARRETDRALEILALLLRDTLDSKVTTVIPRLWLLRAQAMLQKAELPQAESLLLAARARSRALNQPAWEWQSAALLSRLYRAQGRAAAAERQGRAAQNIATALANTLNDLTRREIFGARAEKMIWDA